MHKRLLIILILCVTFFLSKAQTDIKNYVRQNSITISTIEPDSSNYDDLEKIGSAIGESTIVMLGEQDHGDAPAFLAKTRLIKYLHEKKGFNVVAFESDFFGLNNGWDNLNKSKNQIDTFLKNNIFPIWTLCDGCQNLFYNTIPNSYKTKNPIIVTGFDNQVYLEYSRMKLTKSIDSVLRKLNLPITKREDYKSNTLSLIDSVSKFSIERKDNLFYDKLLEQLNIIKSEISSSLEIDNFWNVLVDNLIAMTTQKKYRYTDYYKSSNARDFQMANNIKWLIKYKYPNEKIIVWAHNYHISKFGGNFSESFLNAANTMGTELAKDSLINRKTYIVGFTSREGTSGRLTENHIYKISKTSNNSIENWFGESQSYAFVDFKKFNNLNPNNSVGFSMKANLIGLNRNHSAQWTHVFDGIFYIKKMFSCTLFN